MTRRIQALTLFLLVVFLGLPLAVQARSVEVRVTADDEDDSSLPSLRAEARDKAFVRAIVQESLSMLQEDILPGRVQVLRDHFEESPRRFVQRFSEKNVKETPTGLTMSVDVTLNRKTLKKELQRIGVFYTADAPRAYSLDLSGGTAEDLEKLGRLQILTGVFVQSGVSPELTLEHGQDGLWKGWLSGNENLIMESSRNLDQVWFNLWSRHFSQGGAVDSLVSDVLLQAAGWESAEAARSFGESLKQWDKAVDSSWLLQISMDPDHVTAVWRIKTSRRQDLDVLLEESLSLRGISYRYRNPATRDRVY
jgi:hypothetical protein